MHVCELARWHSSSVGACVFKPDINRAHINTHTHTHTELYALVGTLESTFLSQTADTHTHTLCIHGMSSQCNFLLCVVAVSCGGDDDDVACIPDICVYRQVILISLGDTNLRRVHIKNVLFYFYILLEIRH